MKLMKLISIIALCTIFSAAGDDMDHVIPEAESDLDQDPAWHTSTTFQQHPPSKKAARTKKQAAPGTMLPKAASKGKKEYYQRSKRLKKPDTYPVKIVFRNLKSKEARDARDCKGKKGSCKGGRSKGRKEVSSLSLAKWNKLHMLTSAEEQGGRGDFLVATTGTIPAPLVGATAAFDQKVDRDEAGAIRGHFIADDMLIPHHQKHIYDRHGLDYLIQAGTKVVSDEYKWPNAVVDYKWETATGTALSNTAHQEKIKTAMKAIEALTPLRFVETTTATDYINFQANATDGCWSYVGKTGGKQGLNLGDGCMTEGTIMHEIGHAIGLIHEQSRFDRDTYVTIHSDNLIAGSAEQFEKATSHGNGEELMAKYDFNSLMHYGPKAFSSNGQDVITVNAPYNCDKCYELGSREKWCAGDIEQMVKMYTTDSTLIAHYEPVWQAQSNMEDIELALHKAGCKDTEDLCAGYKSEYGCPAELDGNVFVKDICAWSCAAENPTKCSTYSSYTTATAAFNAAVETLSGPAAAAAVQMAAAETERRQAESEVSLTDEELADGDGQGEQEEFFEQGEEE